MESELTFFRVIPTLRVLGWQLISQLWEFVADYVCNLLVAEVACRDKEAFTGGFWAFSSPHMGQCKVTDIYPKKGARGGNLVFGFSNQDVADALI